MELVVDRFKQAADHTLGRLMVQKPLPRPGTSNSDINVLYIPREFLCFTLEDIYRPVKVMGQTRIPAGRYEIKLRPEGGKYQKYVMRFGEWQKPGMLHITNVPNFEWILIHPGNTMKDTEGCLLVGDAYDGGAVLRSVEAYQRIYDLVSSKLLDGEKVYITYEDNDR